MPQGTSEPEILKEDGEKDKTQYACHHIIPSSELHKLLKLTKKIEPIKRKQILENYLNKEHIRGIIIECVNDPNLTRDKHGKLILASFVNNPNIMVYGPAYCKQTKGSKKHRGREPNNNKDTELAELQNSPHQIQTKKFEVSLQAANTTQNAENTITAVNNLAEIPQAQALRFVKYLPEEGSKKDKNKIKDKYYAQTEQ